MNERALSDLRGQLLRAVRTIDQELLLLKHASHGTNNHLPPEPKSTGAARLLWNAYASLEPSFTLDEAKKAAEGTNRHLRRSRVAYWHQLENWVRQGYLTKTGGQGRSPTTYQKKSGGQG